MNFDEKTEIEEMNVMHTVNAIEIAAEISTSLLVSRELNGFEKLYREIYPLFYRENLRNMLNPVEIASSEDDEFDGDSDDLNDDEKRVIEIILKKPEDITESDKRELISLFGTFVNLFGCV